MRPYKQQDDENSDWKETFAEWLGLVLLTAVITIGILGYNYIMRH